MGSMPRKPETGQYARFRPCVWVVCVSLSPRPQQPRTQPTEARHHPQQDGIPPQPVNPPNVDIEARPHPKEHQQNGERAAQFPPDPCPPPGPPLPRPDALLHRLIVHHRSRFPPRGPSPLPGNTANTPKITADQKMYQTTSLTPNVTPYASTHTTSVPPAPLTHGSPTHDRSGTFTDGPHARAVGPLSLCCSLSSPYISPVLLGTRMGEGRECVRALRVCGRYVRAREGGG